MIVAQADDGALYDVDTGEELAELPRGRTAAGAVLYCIGRLRWWPLLRRYAKPGDRVTGPRPGVPRSLSWRTGGRPARIVPATSWGVDPDEPFPAQLAALADIRAAWEELGERPASTAGGAAGRWVEAHLAAVDGGRARQLPPAFRWAATAAGYTGPALALRASVPGSVGVELDRVAAYLSEMRQPVPILASWLAEGPVPWDRLRVRMSAAGPWRRALVTARVDAAGGGWGFPCPLPVRTPHGIRWGGGEGVVGCWPYEWLATCVDMGGAVVRDVLDVVSCDTSHALAALADRIEAVPFKPLRKALYTRAVAMMAFRPWPSTRVEGLDGQLGAWEEPSPWWTQAVPPGYRPDLAGAVWAGNAWRVVRETMARLALGEAVALVHVDALWLQAGARPPGPGWAVKAEGHLRVYGPGMYDVGAKVGRMGGVEPIPLPPGLLNDQTGAWSADPVSDPGALWHPHPARPDECEPWVSAVGPAFTPLGWLRDRTTGPEQLPAELPRQYE